MVKGDGNLWWSGGINAGLKFAINQLNAEYLVWWNNDILPDIKYYENLIRIIKEFDHNTIIGSKIYLDENMSTIWSMGGVFNAINGSGSRIIRSFKNSIKSFKL